MKQYKDEESFYYTIKIRRIREVKGNKNHKFFKDKLWCVDIKDFMGGGIAFCQPTLKKAFNQIKKQIYA